MINHTLSNLIFIRVAISVLQAIAPSSVVYTAALVYRHSARNGVTQWPRFTLFQTFCSAEAIFFLFFLGYRVYLQGEAIHPPLRARDERRKLFDKVRSEVHNPERFLSGWFRGAKLDDIGRESLKVFINWAFWEGRATTADEGELIDYVDGIEDMVGRKFPDHGPAKSLRLTLDPVEMDYRSLVWYSIIMLTDTLGSVALLRSKYLYYRTSFTSSWVFPPRLASLLTTRLSPARDLSYWYRPHTSKTRLPVVFLHGVGIGLQPYVDFLRLLDTSLNGRTNDKSDGEVGILALETLPISSRLTHPILSRSELRAQLTKILDHHGFKHFVLIAHSYGTVLSSHILTDDALAARTSSVLFIDPVTFLLHMPDVAYNFTIRKPKRANEWQLWYFASKDPGIAHTLGRHLFWFESVLWRDRVMELVGKGMRMTVSLSGRDLIVDTAAVGKYLMENDVPDPVMGSNGTTHMKLQPSKPSSKESDWKKRPWTGEGLETLWWEDYDHAQAMEGESCVKLVDVVCAYSKAGP